MPQRNRLASAAAAPAAGDPSKHNNPGKDNNPSDINTAKPEAEFVELARRRVSAQNTRDFRRLLGFPEALTLDQQPGAAIHLYHELIAPYEKTPHKKAPALLAMHFRDLARLQLELQAWEAIRDAEMKHRAEQVEIEVSRRRFQMDREVGATAPNLFEKGLCRQPDSSGKFRNQSECLTFIKGSLWRREFSDLQAPLERLYGKDLIPEHERGQIIGAACLDLMKPQGDKPPDDDEIKQIMMMIDDEHRDVMRAWELEILEKTITESEKRGRLAPTREDHWMNRQGERLRQAIDRKMKFTVALLKVLGLAEKNKPTHRKRRRRERRKINRRTANVA